MSDRPDVEGLRAALERMTRPDTWRGGSVDRTDIFVHHPEGLAGNCGERVILRANPHFAYDDDVQGCAAVVAAASALLDHIARLEAALGEALTHVPRTITKRCSDPQCGDSTWDHYCDEDILDNPTYARLRSLLPGTKETAP